MLSNMRPCLGSSVKLQDAIRSSSDCIETLVVWIGLESVRSCLLVGLLARDSAC